MLLSTAQSHCLHFVSLFLYLLYMHSKTPHYTTHNPLISFHSLSYIHSCLQPLIIVIVSDILRNNFERKRNSRRFSGSLVMCVSHYYYRLPPVWPTNTSRNTESDFDPNRLEYQSVHGSISHPQHLSNHIATNICVKDENDERCIFCGGAFSDYSLDCTVYHRGTKYRVIE